MLFRFKVIESSFLVFLLVVMLAVTSYAIVKAHDQVVFSPDGKLFLFAEENSITIWETESGRKLQTFTITRYVGYTVFLSDGKAILSTDGENLIWLDIKTGKRIKTIPYVRNGEFQTVSTDGKLLADRYWIEKPLGSAEKISESIKLYDAASGKLKKTFKYPLIYTSCISFLQNNQDLLLVGRQKTLLVSAKTGRVKKEFESIEEAWSCGVSPGGEAAAIGGGGFDPAKNDFVQIAAVRGNKKYVGLDKTYAALFGMANAVGFSTIDPHVAYVVSGIRAEKGGSLIVWDTRTGKIKQTYRNRLEIASADFSPDGKTIVFNDIGDNIFLFDVAAGAIVREYVGGETGEPLTSRRLN